MTQTKFTKGEWVAKKGNTKRLEYAAWVECNKNVIHTSIGKGSSKEKIANAHLIAAAPEMYAFIDRLQLDVERDMQRDELLAKARGEK